MRWPRQLAAGLAVAALCCAYVVVAGEQERSAWPSSEIPAPRGVVRIATYNLWNLFFHWNFRSEFIAEQVRPTRTPCLSTAVQCSRRGRAPSCASLGRFQIRDTRPDVVALQEVIEYDDGRTQLHDVRMPPAGQERTWSRLVNGTRCRS